MLQSHHAESDVCRAAMEHQALPHLVKTVTHCVTGADAQRKSVCVDRRRVYMQSYVYFGTRSVATIKDTEVMTLVFL